MIGSYLNASNIALQQEVGHALHRTHHRIPLRAGVRAPGQRSAPGTVPAVHALLRRWNLSEELGKGGRKVALSL